MEERKRVLVTLPTRHELPYFTFVPCKPAKFIEVEDICLTSAQVVYRETENEKYRAGYWITAVAGTHRERKFNDVHLREVQRIFFKTSANTPYTLIIEV